MTKPRPLETLLVALSLLCGVRLPGQSSVAALKGSIYDVSGATFSGATIAALNSRTGDLRTTKAGNRGEYSFEGLLPGKYELRVEGSGFIPDVRVMWIPAGIALVADAVLCPAPTHGYGDVIRVDVQDNRAIPGGPGYRGVIQGRVLSKFGGRILKVQIVAENLDTHEIQSAEAAEDGTFVINGLPEGLYKVRAGSGGYSPEFRFARIEYAVDPAIEFRLDHR